MIALGWCRVSLVGLLLLQPVWFGWLHPPERVPVALIVALATLPLLAATLAAWSLRARGLVIAGCLLLLYFSFGVMEAWANPPQRIPALMQVGLVTLYFIALPALRAQSARDD